MAVVEGRRTAPPAPPWTSPRTLMADAMALLMPTPQVMAMRAIGDRTALGGRGQPPRRARLREVSA